MSSRDGNAKKQTQNRSSSMSVITNLLNQGFVQLNQQKSDPNGDYTPIFFQEIADIMRGYGDCDHPLRESVILVEKIVIKQMRSILNDVINLAIERKQKPQPTQRDFEFLMRKHPVKIFRLQKHLKDLEFRRRYQDIISGRASNFNDEFDVEKSDEETDEMPEKYDEEKIRRLFRADRISLTLNGTQYSQFNEARRTSFHCRNSNAIRTKLRTLLQPPAEAQISGHIYTILGFLVHETIATIVDYAILTRLDSSNRGTDPYGRVTSSGEFIMMIEYHLFLFIEIRFVIIHLFIFCMVGASFNMLHACPEVTQGRGSDGIKPITIQEIHEAIRRHTYSYNRPMGMHRNAVDRRHCVPYLAL